MIQMLKPTTRILDTRVAMPPPKTVDADLRDPRHQIFREQVLINAGYQCQAVERGRRCEVLAPERLFADHIEERKDGGDKWDPANGQCLCGRHHTLKTARARLERMRD